MPIDKEILQSNTVIAGASAAGLAAAACLKKEGAPYILLEKTEQVASAWRRHYDRLHLHTNKALSALPYKSFPPHYPKYPSRDQVVAYLESYTEEFQLRPRFNQEVISAEYVDGKWRTETHDSAYVSDNLVIATGYTHRPHKPTFPGMNQFRGETLHSSEYRNGAAYEDKKVLVVGFGNSAGEIAIDLCEHGAQTAMSVRSPVNVIPRDLLGIPVLALGIALSKLPAQVADAISAPIMRLFMGDLRKYGLRKPPYGPITQIKEQSRVPLLDIGTVDLIKKGRIKIFPGSTGFTGDRVEFVNGVQEQFDSVILATGYRPDVVSFLRNVDGVLDKEKKPVVSGRESSIPGLYFCGFYVSPTGMLREIGIEAKNIARQIRGKLDSNPTT